ncbi:MAG: CCA tRNA nucleotidyltransferase [Actinobacteria bacterium]|nr:CCA tRNA nucleotidyltransferase [Actinomycetota bacterium]MBU1493187.1 CCA tRNA nucleotidyltransferase [Actinomycetota bacterium]
MIPARIEHLVRADGPAVLLARRFEDAGHALYLVGGSVRDAMLGRTDPDTDLDYTTDARPGRIEEIVGEWADSVFTIGAQFGTIGAILAGVTHEITTFRSEIYRDESRKPVVSFSDDLETDLSRRDFAVNAMALRLLPEPEMIDPYGGLGDLAAGVLRTPLDPGISFGDDPLRMLRLFRFVSTLGFTADPEALAAVMAMRERLAIVSPERIRDELSRLMVGEHVAAALEGLAASGLSEEFLPELSALATQHDPLHRHKDVLAHTIAVVAKSPPDLVVRLAALFHDIGKPETREFGKGTVTFHHHEVVGARMTRARMKDLRFSKDEVEQVSRLVYLHMRPHTFKMGWTDRAVRRYVRDAGPLLEPLNALVRCDVTTRNEKRERVILRRIDELEERIDDLRQREELDAIRPPIDGNRVMAFLGAPPGPLIGRAMDMLLEYRLDEGPYSEEEALGLLRAWAASEGIEVAGE